MNAPDRLNPDLERYAARLAPAGALLVPFGSCLGGVVGLMLALVGVGLLLAACYSAKDGLLVFGPFVRAEVIRHTRRGRPWLWRAMYAIAAGAILFLNINAFASEVYQGRGSIARIAEATSNATYWFAALLAVYILLLTFQLMPGIIAEERESKRLDLLLATDLRPREILLGKVTGRFLLILDPVLAVAPVLSIVLLLGGVPPLFVIVYVFCLAATVFSITGVSLFYSVFSEKRKDAIGRTFMPFVFYLGVTSVAFGGLYIPRLAMFPASVGADIGIVLGDFWPILAVANPGLILLNCKYAISSAAPLEPVLWGSTLKYVAAHLGIGLIFGLLACSRMRGARVWATKQSLRHAAKVAKAEGRITEGVNGKIVLAVIPVERPPVTDDSLTWWERYGHLRPGQISVATKLTSYAGLRRLFLWTVGAGILLRVLSIVWPWGMVRFNVTTEAICAAVLWFGTWPLFLGPLFRGASCIAKERTQDTIEGLRLMPLTSEEIVYQKWKGVLMEVLPTAMIVLIVASGLSCVLYVNPLTLLVLPFVVLPGAAMCASIGVFFSSKARSPGRATWYMILTLFGVGYMTIVLLGSLFESMKGPGGIAVPLPPAGTAFAMAIQPSWGETRVAFVMSAIVWCLVGMLIQSLIAHILFRKAARRFEADRTPS